MKRLLISLIAVIILKSVSFAQNEKHILYKKVDSTSLYMDVIYPKDAQQKTPRPAIVFFFGGGWVEGNMDAFRYQAEYLDERGLISVLVDYRIKKIHGTTPFESVKDAKSAMRYVRGHANELGINPDSIIASGGSAGGHLAAATAFIKGYNEATDDLSISCVPQALVLFNPVIDNGPGGYGYDRIRDQYKDFSPLFNIKKGAPPTVFFLGTKDKLIPVATAEYYKTVMERVGSRCDLQLFDNQEHAFFNKPEYFSKTLALTDEFLTSLGYLKGKPLLDRIDFYAKEKALNPIKKK
nr:alpha/beta hydrolase [uncultured Pedobacter sp.]